MSLVWAFRPLPQLDYRTGLVECDQAIADELIARELVQDAAIGVRHFRLIEVAGRPADGQPALDLVAPQGYATRDLRAGEPVKRPRGRPRGEVQG